jgi:hypothetical protein
MHRLKQLCTSWKDCSSVGTLSRTSRFVAIDSYAKAIIVIVQRVPEGEIPQGIALKLM